MAATSEDAPFPIVPGQSLGPFYLGACMYEVLHIIKGDKDRFKQVDLHFDSTQPIAAPVIVSLPRNGFRMRFDGADQRLRLIEISDFKKIRLVHKSSELAKHDQPGPVFRRIYQIFGASYPGEYMPPKSGHGTGKYVLSWSGIAFDFPLQHSAWAPEKDHVSLLGSSAAGSATAMALFEGASWTEARRDLFLRIPSGPRLSANATRPKDGLPAELELAHIRGDKLVEISRRAPASPLVIILGSTTTQDLIVELGPPEATHTSYQNESVIAPQQRPNRRRPSSMSNGRAHAGSQPSSYSSTGTDTYDADFDSGEAEEDAIDPPSRNVFWCYFSHGMDILLAPKHSNDPSPVSNGASAALVVQKVIIHGNVPGSYAFNRHRRLRWNLNFPEKPYLEQDSLNSESDFERDLKPALMHVFEGALPEGEMGRGKVINRTWGGGGDDMGDSSFFLPDAEKELVEGGGSEQWLGNTKLYAFPGMGFEVLENGAVATLTVS